MSNDDEPQVAHVGLKVPPFWRQNPTLWFSQLEAQFALSGIKLEITKFHHVLANMDTQLLTSVQDIMAKPPSESRYSALKSRLIATHSDSESQRIKQLLSGCELGNQCPSQLLTHMRALAGEQITENILQSLWSSRLPQYTQAILAASNESLSQLAVMADKIMEHVPHHLQTVKQPQAAPDLDLLVQIATLTSQIQQLSTAMQTVHQHQRSPHKRQP